MALKLNHGWSTLCCIPAYMYTASDLSSQRYAAFMLTGVSHVRSFVATLCCNPAESGVRHLIFCCNTMLHSCLPSYKTSRPAVILCLPFLFGRPAYRLSRKLAITYPLSSHKRSANPTTITRVDRLSRGLKDEGLQPATDAHVDQLAGSP